MGIRDCSLKNLSENYFRGEIAISENRVYSLNYVQIRDNKKLFE